MLEARITYVNGKTHIIEANTIEMLKTKCKPFIEDKDVFNIWVYEIKHLGWFKNDLNLSLL